MSDDSRKQFDRWWEIETQYDLEAMTGKDWARLAWQAAFAAGMKAQVAAKMPSYSNMFHFLDAYKNRNKCDISVMEFYCWLRDMLGAAKDEM